MHSFLGWLRATFVDLARGYYESPKDLPLVSCLSNIENSCLSNDDVVSIFTYFKSQAQHHSLISGVEGYHAEGGTAQRAAWRLLPCLKIPPRRSLTA